MTRALLGFCTEGLLQRDSLKEVGKWASAQQTSQEALIQAISDMCYDGERNGAP